MKDKEPVKILYITQEINPYIKETEIADICRQFPQYTIDKGCEIRTFMPCFGHINERRNQLHEVQRLSGLNVIIDDNDHPLIIKVATIQTTRMQVYFIDNEDYFHRNGIAKDKEGIFFDDNDERGIFYVRSVLETIKKLRWTPDVVHCHGWITSLAPLYIKRVYQDEPFFQKAKIVYSLYNDKFNNSFSASFSEKLKFDGILDGDLEQIKNKEVSYNDLCKLAIDFSEAVIEGSESSDKSLFEYAQSKDKKILPFCGNEIDEYLNPYVDLYNSL